MGPLRVFLPDGDVVVDEPDLVGLVPVLRGAGLWDVAVTVQGESFESQVLSRPLTECVVKALELLIEFGKIAVDGVDEVVDGIDIAEFLGLDAETSRQWEREKLHAFNPSPCGVYPDVDDAVRMVFPSFPRCFFRDEVFALRGQRLQQEYPLQSLELLDGYYDEEIAAMGGVLELEKVLVGYHFVPAGVAVVNNYQLREFLDNDAPGAVVKLVLADKTVVSLPVVVQQCLLAVMKQAVYYGKIILRGLPPYLTKLDISSLFRGSLEALQEHAIKGINQIIDEHNITRYSREDLIRENREIKSPRYRILSSQEYMEMSERAFPPGWENEIEHLKKVRKELNENNPSNTQQD